MRSIYFLLLSGAMLALPACSAADRSAAPPTATAEAPPATSTAPAAQPTSRAEEAQAGWYMERDGVGLFQPCGQDKQLTVDSAELRQRARDFGLEPDTPVYVRLSGASDGNRFTVSRIDQFGSPEPVRTCAMTGTVTQ